MKSDRILIVFASWEDRFSLGVDRNLARWECSRALVLYYDAYADWTIEAREVVKRNCESRGIAVRVQELEMKRPAAAWHTLCEHVRWAISDGNKVLLDISTMPREVIWNVLWLLELWSVDSEYCYHCPDEYADDWLSRDPGAPRLVYKLSGEASIFATTALLVTAGYDLQRVDQLVKWYEPEKVLIAIQSHSRFKQNQATMDRYREGYGGANSYEWFEIDAYSEDHGQAAIQQEVDRIQGTHNVVMSSLGPKLTAIALFQVQRSSQVVALAYAPSNQFNREYSHGIGECFTGAVLTPKVEPMV